jgi:hypothetical protein
VIDLSKRHKITLNGNCLIISCSLYIILLNTIALLLLQRLVSIPISVLKFNAISIQKFFLAYILGQNHKYVASLPELSNHTASAQ